MSEELDAIDEELLAAIARIKGHPVRKAVSQPVSVIYPVSAAAAAEEAARIKAEEELLKKAVPGQLMPDDTIYVGKYAPKDQDGKSLCLEFNVFAAREDLPGGMRTYDDTIKHIAELKDWNGYDGESCASDGELYEALKNDTYKDGWIVPTRELLFGTDTEGAPIHREGKLVQKDNLFDLQNTGAFKGTFAAAVLGSLYDPQQYWSSTQCRPSPNCISAVQMAEGGESWYVRDVRPMSCRPVRLVPCK